MSERKELVLEGTALSDGIAIGKGHILKDPCVDPVPEFSIEKNDADSEIERYRQALGKSRDELLNLQACVACESPDEATSIIDTHIQMLEDPFITTHVEDRIRSRLQNTEAVFRSVITEYEQQFSKQTMPTFVSALSMCVIFLSASCGIYVPNISENFRLFQRIASFSAKKSCPQMLQKL